MWCSSLIQGSTCSDDVIINMLATWSLPRRRWCCGATWATVSRPAGAYSGDGARRCNVSVFPRLAATAAVRALPRHAVASTPSRTVSSSLPSPLTSLLLPVIYLAPLLLLPPNDQKIM
jgi:hypothetical protein